jgi:zinc protease
MQSLAGRLRSAVRGAWCARHPRETHTRGPRTADRAPVLALLILLAAAAPALAQRAELEKRIQRTTLTNGLEVIVVENHGVPLVTIEAVVRNGAFTQTPAFEGLAHLYEHMIFGANAYYPQAEDFLARLSELGAEYNGRTAEEAVNYWLTLAADSVEPGMRALAAALREPVFRQDELEREREVVIGEYDRNESNPFYHLQRAVDRALWTTAWSRKNPLGERNVILATTPTQMREIQRKYYVPNNTALIVAGAVSAERVFRLARDLFGDWKRAPDPFEIDPIPPAPPLVRDTGVIVEQPVGTAIVMLRWQGPSARGDVAATYAADVFSDVMNADGSRFKRRLVDGGLFQSIQVHYYTLNQMGPITIFGETTPERLREAIAALEAELEKVDDPGYITAPEIESVTRRRIADTMFQLERSSGFAHQLAFWWSVTGLDYFLGYVDAMARQTPEELRAYARKYIIGKPHVTGVLLSPQARRQIGLTEAELAGRGPSS